jgi:hypothetical protein
MHSRPYLKNNFKKGWGLGSSGRAPKKERKKKKTVTKLNDA